MVNANVRSCVLLCLAGAHQTHAGLRVGEIQTGPTSSVPVSYQASLSVCVCVCVCVYMRVCVLNHARCIPYYICIYELY